MPRPERRGRVLLASLLLLVLFGCASGPATSERRPPNVIFVLVDDMGFGDLGVTGNRLMVTPNIDRLAGEGTLFTEFHVNSPICSASRAALLTGRDPQRVGITSYLSSRAENRAKAQRDWLPVEAPTLARGFRSVGYATGHFGKWHLGGGRDVGDAPLPTAYGFDKSLTQWEGLGDRLLIEGQPLSRESAELGRGAITWGPKHRFTAEYVDAAIRFAERNRDRPFFVQLWLTDIHDPWVPSPTQLAAADGAGRYDEERRMLAVLHDMDRELGRLLARLDALGLRDDTLVVLTSDNGPTAWPRYYKGGGEAPGSTGGRRGRKWSLYEGGIRLPMIVRWPGRVPAGRVDRATLMLGTDLMPTLARIAGFAAPAGDGVDMGGAWRGVPDAGGPARFWDHGSFGRAEAHIHSGLPADRSPPLAMREGRWKLLATADGAQVELYDLGVDPGESRNLASAQETVVRRMLPRLLRWRAGLGCPPGETACVAGVM